MIGCATCSTELTVYLSNVDYMEEKIHRLRYRLEHRDLILRLQDQMCDGHHTM